MAMTDYSDFLFLLLLFSDVNELKSAFGLINLPIVQVFQKRGFVWCAVVCWFF